MASIYLRDNTYWIKYNLNGKCIRQSLKTKDRHVAKVFKNQKELELAQGRAGLPSHKKISTLLDEYEIYAKARKLPATYKKEFTHLRKFVKDSGLQTIKDITHATIQNFITSLSQSSYSPASMNNYRKHISNLMNYAVSQNYTHENPVKKIHKVKEPKNPPRFLSSDEIEKLLKEAKKSPLYPMVATALYTGMRVKELINLEWKDFDFSKETVIVRNKANFQTKSKTFRVIPLNSRLKRVLRPLSHKDGYCFTYAGTPYAFEPRKSLLSILRQANIKNCGWHILRKTFASHLAMAGVSLYKIAKWLGHTDPKLTFSTYAHLAPTADNDINKVTF